MNGYYSSHLLYLFCPPCRKFGHDSAELYSQVDLISVVPELKGSWRVSVESKAGAEMMGAAVLNLAQDHGWILTERLVLNLHNTMVIDCLGGAKDVIQRAVTRAKTIDTTLLSLRDEFTILLLLCFLTAARS